MYRWNIRSKANWLFFIALLAACFCGATKSHADLIGFYDFEGNVLDSSGNGNHASVVGTDQYSSSVASAIAGRSTQSFDFNGSTHVALPFAAIDFAGTAQATGATFSAWVQTASPQDQDYVFSVGSSTSTTPIYGLQGGAGASGDDFGRVFYRPDAGGNNFQTGSTTLFGNGWHHIALTDDGDRTQLWIDGIFELTLDYPAGPLTSDLNSLGALVRSNGQGFQLTGQIDEAAFFSQVLTEAQIGLLASGVAPSVVVPEPASLAVFGMLSVVLGGWFTLRSKAKTIRNAIAE